jgi:hypothetical protein
MAPNFGRVAWDRSSKQVAFLHIGKIPNKNKQSRRALAALLA